MTCETGAAHLQLDFTRRCLHFCVLDFISLHNMCTFQVAILRNKIVFARIWDNSSFK
jgi:hypothetical protein